MSSIENTIRFESASSGVTFRKVLYGRDEAAAAVMDCIALANADLKAQRRYLFLGVDDVPGGERRLTGVDRSELARFKRRFLALVAESIEPAPIVAVRGLEIDGRMIGVVRLKECHQLPYLTKKPIAGKLPAGVGFIRRGARNMALTRSDLQRMFAAQPAAQPQSMPIEIGFPDTGLGDRICLPVLRLRKLPSELAAEQLKGMLAARDKAREAFGRTETQFHRLMHAKYFGLDAPFESHTDESLMHALKRVKKDNKLADRHYKYEVRAHKLGLVAANRHEADFHDLSLRLTITRIPGIGVAGKIYTGIEDAPDTDGYPQVRADDRRIVIETEIASLQSGRQVSLFREPVRFWTREEAASKTVDIDYELSADELDTPICGTLHIDIDPESLRSV